MQVPDTIVVRWTDVILSALEIGTNEKPLRLGPPQVARLLAMVYTAAFQAWAPYSDTGKAPISGGAPRRPAAQRTEQNKAVAISYAIYRTAVHLMRHPRLKQVLDAHMAALHLDIGVTSTTGNAPDAIGNAAAAAVINDRKNDGANESGTEPGSPSGPPIPYADYTGYAPSNPTALVFAPTLRSHVVDPSRWQPLSYVDAQAGVVETPGFITPHWERVRPFALSSASQFRPSPPEPYMSQAFLDQARFVLEVQRELTVEQKIVAEYWADGPKSWLPPGHWTEIASRVSRHYFHTTDQDVRMFFALTNAILDASIATWEAKRFYDYARPITAIRWLFAGFRIDAWGGPGAGTTKVWGERWRPFQKDTFPTPPFPEYTSGHSAFSMAAAVILRAFTGTDRFTMTHEQLMPLAAEPEITGFPITLRWESFTEAAFSAGESRLFGGIHFYQVNVAGLDLGRKVGLAAWAKAQTFF